MRIVVANLSALYRGRGETDLAPYNRIIIVKNDGSVSIHGEQGYKPLNYMTSANELVESEVNGERVWTFHNKKESLVVTFHHIYNDFALDLGDEDPGYNKRNGTEYQLQGWLAQNLSTLDEDLRFLEREHQTGDGPVDLLGEHRNGALLAIEVKRDAPMTTVSQVLRYRDALRESNPDREVEAIIAAVTFKAKTLTLAERKGVRCLNVPATWKQEAEDATPSAEDFAPQDTTKDKAAKPLGDTLFDA